MRLKILCEVEDARGFGHAQLGRCSHDGCVSMDPLQDFAAGTKPAAVQMQAQAFLACGGGSA